jgi:hypothetical protein
MTAVRQNMIATLVRRAGENSEEIKDSDDIAGTVCSLGSLNRLGLNKRPVVRVRGRRLVGHIACKSHINRWSTGHGWRVWMHIFKFAAKYKRSGEAASNLML